MKKVFGAAGISVESHRWPRRLCESLGPLRTLALRMLRSPMACTEDMTRAFTRRIQEAFAAGAR